MAMKNEGKAGVVVVSDLEEGEMSMGTDFGLVVL